MKTAKELHAERQKLQKQAGLPVSVKMIYEIKEAEAENVQLRYLVDVLENAQKGAPLTPPTTAPTAANAIPLPIAAKLPNSAGFELPAIPAGATSDNGLHGMDRVRAGIKAEMNHTMPLRAKKAVASVKAPTREQLLKCIAVADPASLHAVMDDWSNADVKAEAERALFSAHLRAPFMRSEETLSDEFYRTAEPKGSARAMRGMQQDRINSILQ